MLTVAHTCAPDGPHPHGPPVAEKAARAQVGRDNRGLRPGWTATPLGYIPPGETYTGPSLEEVHALMEVTLGPVLNALEQTEVSSKAIRR